MCIEFQNASMHRSKVNRRTYAQTERQSESNMPSQLNFQSWGHKNGQENHK